MNKRRAAQSEYDITATISNLSSVVMNALSEYGDYVAAEAKEAVKEAAEECRQEIAANSPRGTGTGDRHGHYADTWKTKEAYYSADECRVTVYNQWHYQLTHLLEYGHAKWIYGYYTGGRVEGKPHIRPAEEHAAQNLINKLKRKL